MKDARDVLRQKEADRARTQSEIEALQLVIPLLTDDQDQAESTKPASAERLATEKRKSA
jgi:hypothetical protein